MKMMQKRAILLLGLLPLLMFALLPSPSSELLQDDEPASIQSESSHAAPVVEDLQSFAPHASGVTPVGDAEEASTGMEVTYGSVLKLMHWTTETRLHATKALYNPKAKYHVVTGFKGINAGSYWSVKPAAASSAKPGDTIMDGSLIKLQNVQTQEWLLCRPNPSPLSRNLEVSCREYQNGEEAGDAEDLWMVEFVDKGKVWTRDQKIRLKHVETGSFLHSHQMVYTQRVVHGQTEVCGITEETQNSVWIAAEGIYLPAKKQPL